MIDLIIIACLLFVAGMSKGFSDALADEGIKSKEWKKKYDLTKPVGREWWYFGFYTPSNAERFPFSSTLLVFLTDRWHLSQLIMLRCFYAVVAVALFDNLLLILFTIFIAFPILTGIGFESVYYRIRKRIREKCK